VSIDSGYLKVIAYLMAGILISYGYNPNPLRRGNNWFLTN